MSEIMILGVNGKYIPINPDKTYQAAVNTFLANGVIIILFLITEKNVDIYYHAKYCQKQP